MSNQYVGEDDELVSNSSARIPVCLCVDVSGSMDGEPIEELQNGIQAFYDAVKGNDQAKNACEICIVAFSNGASVIEDYSSVDKKESIHLSAEGGTDMGEGVELALKKLDERKQEYKKNGVEYYQPWLVLMSDGDPTDDVAQAQAKTKQMQMSKKLSVFAIGIGDCCNLETLSGFTTRKALKLKGYKFEEFFEWLGKSVATVSQSQVGDTVKLDTAGIDDWGTL
jgi:uncharacterized protein YegL